MNPTKSSEVRPVPERSLRSAIAVAERVAEERAAKVGEEVGYAIRLENRAGPSTRMLFCTTGILLRRLQSDPFMDGVSHIIVDEVRL